MKSLESFGACCGLQLEISLHRAQARHPTRTSCGDMIMWTLDFFNPLVDTKNPGVSPTIVTETAIFCGTPWWTAQFFRLQIFTIAGAHLSAQCFHSEPCAVRQFVRCPACLVAAANMRPWRCKMGNQGDHQHHFGDRNWRGKLWKTHGVSRLEHGNMMQKCRVFHTYESMISLQEGKSYCIIPHLPNFTIWEYTKYVNEGLLLGNGFIMLYFSIYVGFLIWGYPNSWVAYFMENPIYKNVWSGGTPISGNLNMSIIPVRYSEPLPALPWWNALGDLLILRGLSSGVVRWDFLLFKMGNFETLPCLITRE